MWQWILALLTSWSADPVAIDQEHPRAAAAVVYAYVAMAPTQFHEKSTVEQASLPAAQ
jgi:hypothetical protein